jgi:hypothetical protein
VEAVLVAMLILAGVVFTLGATYAVIKTART